MSFFKDEEIEDLHVSKMIIHVVGKTGGPFSPQPEIAVQEEPFFRTRIVDQASDAVHAFDQQSPVKLVLERMAGGAMSFEAGGQNLAHRFYEMHVQQSVAGAFFVFELLSADSKSKFYALVKYDYREAVELANAGGKSVLRAIVQAFVKEKRAVQKIALVRVRDGIAEMAVSASDRMKEAPDLTDYFQSYLGVTRARSTSELSRKLNEAMRRSLEDIRDHLPNRDVGKAVAMAKTALKSRGVVTNEDVVDSILHAAGRPEDEAVSGKIDTAIRKQLKKHNLQDVSFEPDKKTLQVSPRLYYQTVENVRLEFPYEELGNSVTKTNTGNDIVFTVRTKKLIEDGTLPNKSGNDA